MDSEGRNANSVGTVLAELNIILSLNSRGLMMPVTTPRGFWQRTRGEGEGV